MKTKHTCYYAILFFLILLNFNSFAQWQTSGPYGGWAYALKQAGSNLFLGNANGVFKSADHGQTWAISNSGIEREAARSITVNGTDLFIATNNGVFMSADNGESWTPKSSGITNLAITAVFSANSDLFASTPDGVFFSSDNGNSWSLTNSGIPATYTIYDFVNMNDTIYAGSYNAGLFRTNDNGTTWTTVAGGFPANSFVYAMITDANTIYAGTDYGVYKSSDRGVTWVSSNTGFPSGNWAQAFAVKPGYLFAGTYSEGILVSTDHGATWSAANTGIPDEPFSTGLPHNYPSVSAMEVSGTNVLAATIQGIYRSPDNGSTWMESNQNVIANNIIAVAANSTTAFSGAAYEGVYKSTDHGASWTRSNSGLTSFDVRAMVAKGSVAFVSVMNEKTFRSDDNGVTWVPARNGINTDVASLKTDGTRVFALTTGAVMTPRTIYQTIDNGVNWTEIPTSSLPGINAIAVNATDIYAGSYNGKINHSNNSGTTWEDISGTLPSTLTIRTILISGSTVFIGTEEMGVYKTSDDGATWQAVNTGITNNFITDLEQQGSTIYAATWGGGVFVSNDMGSSWNSFNSGLADFHVNAITNDTTEMYAATDIATYNSPFAATGINVLSESSLSVYPNPSNGRINIGLQQNEKIVVTVDDITGKEIYNYSGNSNNLEKIDLSGKGKGIYFLKISTETTVSDHKIIIQ